MKRTTLTIFYNQIVRNTRVKSLFTFVFLLFCAVLAGCSLSESAVDGESSNGNSDPVTVDNAVAFIKRPLIFDDNGDLEGDNLAEPQTFRPGAVLYIKDRASSSAAIRDITSVEFSDPAFLNDDGELLYDVKDLNASYDGKKLLFSMRAPDIENADDEDQPKWNIWEYDLEVDELRRIIEGRDTAEEGHDISPSYLPDGRILFTSTRQRRSKAILLDEEQGKSQFSGQDEDGNTDAFVLHVMDDDGSNIEQITFNQSHDLNPIVLENGKILFSRWDNAGQTANNGINLYQINPDGSQLTYLYGRHSHDTGAAGDSVQFVKPRELENGNILVQLRTFETNNFANEPIEIDINNFVEIDAGIDGATGEGQTPVVSDLDNSDEISLKGTFGSFFPLYDGTNRYLISWSVCLVALTDIDPDTDGNQAGSAENCTAEKIATGDYSAVDPQYGLWIYDADTNTQLPIGRPETGQTFDEALLMTSRPLPYYIPPATLTDEEQILADDGYGVIHIKSVYDFDGVDTSPAGLAVLADPLQTLPGDRPRRFIRIEKPVAIPSDEVRDIDNTAFGRSRAQLMREILGYAPIEPDGSVKVAVPANVAFAISILDENGQRRSARHQNWMQVAPGETLQCIGCHTGNSEIPHGRADAEPEAVNVGAETTGLPFPNTHPLLFTDMGETMAETYARIKGAVRRLTPDIIYDDEWTDPAGAPAESFSYAYSDLATMAPMNNTCLNNWTDPIAPAWNSACRITINYEQHIHPLWSVDRRIFEADEVTLREDQTCTSCHTNVDDMDMTRVPDQQLDLTDGPSTDEPDHYKSYRELLFNDNEVELSQGALIDRLVDTGEIEMVPQVDENDVPVLDEDGNQILVPRLVPLLDENSEPVLDGEGNPILVTVPIQTTVNVNPSMSTAGARNSTRFMSVFQTGQTHENYLNTAEMKLISEWLDLGAQYFNNPYDAPAN